MVVERSRSRVNVAEVADDDPQWPVKGGAYSSLGYCPVMAPATKVSDSLAPGRALRSKTGRVHWTAATSLPPDCGAISAASRGGVR